MPPRSDERQLVALFVKVHRDVCPGRHLPVRNHRSQRLGEVSVDGTTELAGAVFHARPLVEHEEAGSGGDLDLERPVTQATLDMTLQVRHMLLEDRHQRVVAQGPVCDYRVDPVHELRRKMTPYRTQSHPLEMCRELGAGSTRPGIEAQTRLDLGHHVSGAQVTRQEDDRVLEVHL